MPINKGDLQFDDKAERDASTSRFTQTCTILLKNRGMVDGWFWSMYRFSLFLQRKRERAIAYNPAVHATTGLSNLSMSYTTTALALDIFGRAPPFMIDCAAERESRGGNINSKLSTPN